METVVRPKQVQRCPFGWQLGSRARGEQFIPVQREECLLRIKGVDLDTEDGMPEHRTADNLLYGFGKALGYRCLCNSIERAEGRAGERSDPCYFLHFAAFIGIGMCGFAAWRWRKMR